MIFRRWKYAKNKKGVTLMEMIVAIVITSILATVLSMMIVPVINSYRTASVKEELQQAVTARLNDMAHHLRGATGVYLTTGKGSFPDTTQNTYQYEGVRNFNVHFGFALVKNGSTYLFPELKIVDWSRGTGSSTVTTQKPEEYVDKTSYSQSVRDLYAIYRDMKLDSDVYVTSDIVCLDSTGDSENKEKDSFFVYVRKNADNSNSGTVLEIHLRVKKGTVTYEGSKTIVCENLVINGSDIKTASFTKDANNNYAWVLTSATISSGNNADNWKRYHSIWFSRDL